MQILKSQKGLVSLDHILPKYRTHRLYRGLRMGYYLNFSKLSPLYSTVAMGLKMSRKTDFVEKRLPLSLQFCRISLSLSLQSICYAGCILHRQHVCLLVHPVFTLPPPPHPPGPTHLRAFTCIYICTSTHSVTICFFL